MTNPQPCLHLLAIDQSTEATGVVLLQCIAGKFYVLAKTPLTADAVRGTTIAARLSRLRSMRVDLLIFLRGLECSIDLVAYEQPFFSARSTHWDAAPMTLGALLSVRPLEGIPCVPIMRAAACRVAGCQGLYQQSAKTSQQREDKRQRLKSAVISWARVFLSLPLTDEENDIADACAVGVAAWEAERIKAVKAADKAAQRALPRTGKAKVGQ